MSSVPFTYHPRCSDPDCRSQNAIYKIGAEWTYGAMRELKNYGMACDLCVHDRLASARKARAALKVADGEEVGPVGVYRLLPGVLDTELSRLPDSQFA